MTKVVCSRCGGSGNYSFNLIHGSMCYGCHGKGFQMVNLAGKARAEKAKAVRASQNAAVQAKTRAASEVVLAEMNSLYGPFDIDTVLGIDQLNKAVAKATGKSVWVHRDERMKKN